MITCKVRLTKTLKQRCPPNFLFPEPLLMTCKSPPELQNLPQPCWIWCWIINRAALTLGWHRGSTWQRGQGIKQTDSDLNCLVYYFFTATLLHQTHPPKGLETRCLGWPHQPLDFYFTVMVTCTSVIPNKIIFFCSVLSRWLGGSN